MDIFVGTSVDAFVGRFMGAFMGVLEGLKTGKSRLVGAVVGALVVDLVGTLVGPLVVPLVVPLGGRGSLSPALCVAQFLNLWFCVFRVEPQSPNGKNINLHKKWGFRRSQKERQKAQKTALFA